MAFTLPSDLPTNLVDNSSTADAAFFNNLSAMGNATKAAVATIGYGFKSASVATEEGTTSTTYADLTTTTDQVTVAVGSSGKVILLVRAQTKTSQASGYYGYMSYELSGANTVAATDTDAIMRMGSNYVTAGFVTLLTGLTAGSTTIKLKYRAQSGCTASFLNRMIAAVPLPSTDGTHASAAFDLSITPSIGMTPDFWGIIEQNTDKSSVAVPQGVSGCWVTLIGGGAAGKDGVAGSAPGHGGGGGARVDRTWIPVASMGATYTVTRGLGGTTSTAAGGSSVFSTGGITLTAGGGGTTSTYDVGGTASATGITAECHSGANYGTSESVNDAAAGGGAGGSWSGTSPINGGYGGASLTVTGQVRNSGVPDDAAPGHGGAGGGGGIGSYSGSPGTGGHGGLYGGGGGGGGISPSARGLHGDGAAGWTQVEWQQV